MAALPQVAVLMGSKSDLALMQPTSDTLASLDIPHMVRVLSAHRTPEAVAQLARDARADGLRVFICAAGAAAHLAGAVAAQTTLPVIGVPLARTPLGGQDALYATVQMPAGTPVATVGVDGAINAALLAAQILALTDTDLEHKLAERRRLAAARVLADDQAVSSGGAGK